MGTLLNADFKIECRDNKVAANDHTDAARGVPNRCRRTEGTRKILPILIECKSFLLERDASVWHAVPRNAQNEVQANSVFTMRLNALRYVVILSAADLSSGGA
ncbi:hypothetical protein [Novipirellula galeiformis]|uniref:hypothetical protein n=1 Tax=Novipirellula galeiformis TaxID=2528004 RepID=UPI0011B6F04F|nr:hypothetical protein [Novipirellula galeiformis]